MSFGAFICLGDAGYQTGETIRSSAVGGAALLRQVAAAAIAIDNANRLIENYRDQRDISRRTLAISEAQQNQLSTVFWPREETFLNEFSVPEAIETVEAMGSRYAGRLVSAVAFAFAAQLREARCGARRYCTSANSKRIQDLMMARGVAMANARVLGRNIGFAEYQARHDINHSRRMQAVGLGRGLINQAMSLFQAAGQGYAAAGQVLGAQLNTALEAFGYNQQVRTNELGRQANSFRDGSAVMPGMTPPSDYSGGGARMPGTVGDTPSFQNRISQGSSFGLGSSMESMYDLSASDTMKGDPTGFSANTEPMDLHYSQAEKMNDGRVGNRDLARTGFATFPVVGVGLGAVTISMDAFPLGYVDHRNEGYGFG